MHSQAEDPAHTCDAPLSAGGHTLKGPKWSMFRFQIRGLTEAKACNTRNCNCEPRGEPVTQF